jgi:single-strand DNA-binding protein
MSNFNTITLLGRLTRDPEVKTFAGGGKVAKFGFAASPYRKKSPQSGQYEDEPMFIDVEVFNRGQGTLANVVEQYCRKGSLILVLGKLHLDQWDDKTTGQKRSKHKIIADSITLVDTKGAGGQQAGGKAPAKASGADSFFSAPPDDDDAGDSSGGSYEQIPF